MDYLFEVSWEVCNKVGGIHTVLKTKAPEAISEFGDNYFVFGPLLQNLSEFEELEDSFYSRLAPLVKEAGLNCRFGRWRIPGAPRTILVDFHNRYDSNKLLYNNWRDFGVDSYAGQWDYIEPTLFSTAVG